MSTSTHRIFVTVGTDHHPFDRIIEWSLQYVEERLGGDLSKLAVQWGTSRVPNNTVGADYVDAEALNELMCSSSVIVTHGGPGTIIEAKKFGNKPIVVPRDPRYGEHVDEHQLRFAKFLDEQGQIHLATTREQYFFLLDHCLQRRQGEGVSLHAPSGIQGAVVRRVGRAVERALQEKKKKDADTERLVILIPTSGGGHLTQCLQLSGWFSPHRRIWVSSDTLDVRTRLSDEDLVIGHFPTTRSVANLLRNTFQSIRVMWRERPDVVLSTGAGIAVPYFWLARITGAITVYIEVYDRIDSATMTARLVAPVTDLFLLQWQRQEEIYPRGKLIGQLL